MKKLRAALIMAAFTVFCGQSILAQGRITDQKVMVVTENLRLREGESKRSQVLGVMPPDTLVEILEVGSRAVVEDIDSNWVKVRTVLDCEGNGSVFAAGQEGWCFGGYLTEYPLLDEEMMEYIQEQVFLVLMDYMNETAREFYIGEGPDFINYSSADVVDRTVEWMPCDFGGYNRCTAGFYRCTRGRYLCCVKIEDSSFLPFLTGVRVELLQGIMGLPEYDQKGFRRNTYYSQSHSMYLSYYCDGNSRITSVIAGYTR